MPLRDWGIGLEELTEYYHKYGLRYTDDGINKESQLWIISRGFIDQVVPYSNPKRDPMKFRGWKPREIDLVGLQIDNELNIKEIRLIQCKESITISQVSEITQSLEYIPTLTGITMEAKKKKVLSNYVSYVKISKQAKIELTKHDVKFLSFEDMTNKLLQQIDFLIKIKRKGFMREPLVWMLRSLRDKKFLV